MASEEYQSSIPQFPAEVQPPSAPTTLPPYPEMILSAIESLNDPNGSNKSSISKHIESTYVDLSPAHSTLLTHHLNKMKAAGQLVFAKNNYLKPDPNSPPPRGRGRPPKPKTPLPEGLVLPPPRPRGRPPKSRDPNELPAKTKVVPTTASVSGRKRGRPPKAANLSPAVSTVVAPVSGGGAPRGRGRPPKVKPAVAATVGA